jgi:S1-C subfamily serine protease
VGPDLRVRLHGRELILPASRVVTIGRDPSSDIHSDNPRVSRRHAVLRPSDGGWLLEDAGSTNGTFVGGRRVSQVLVRDLTAVSLGEPGRGEPVWLMPAGVTGPGRWDTLAGRPPGGPRTLWTGLVLPRRPLALVVLALALVVILLAGFLLVRAVTGDRNPGLTGLQLATVRIVAMVDGRDGGLAPGWTGSGTVVDDDGLILTNAHVVAPNADGLDRQYGSPLELPEPRQLVIEVIRRPGEQATPAYAARVVAIDGYLDLAVVEVAEDLQGRPLRRDDVALESVPLGDSIALREGDPVVTLGFPGISETRSITVTRGVVSSFSPDPLLRDARAWIHTDARVAHGSSGGLAADADGRVVGVPTTLTTDDDGSPAASYKLRPIHLALPLIERARASRR